MIKKIFTNSGKFWNWLVVSSVDPSSVALSIQGILSMTIVQTLFGLLPMIGIHPSFTLAGLSAGITSFIYTVATIVSSLVTLYGLLRKAIVTIHGLVPAPVAGVNKTASTPTQALSSQTQTTPTTTA
jgi:hypothetical protein